MPNEVNPTEKAQQQITDPTVPMVGVDPNGGPAHEQPKPAAPDPAPATKAPDAAKPEEKPADTPEAAKPEDGKPEDAKPEDEASKDGEGVVKIDHENESIKAVQTVLATAKVTEKDAASIFGKAVQSGDMADVDMAALEAKVGAAQAGLIKAAIGNYLQTEGAEALRIRDKIVADFGKDAEGADLWPKAKEFFNARMDDPQVKTLLQMLDERGMKADLAIGALKQMYLTEAKPQVGSLPVTPGGTGTADMIPGGQIKDRAEYISLLDKAKSTAEVNAINSRWLASKAAGSK